MQSVEEKIARHAKDGTVTTRFQFSLMQFYFEAMIGLVTVLFFKYFVAKLIVLLNLSTSIAILLCIVSFHVCTRLDVQLQAGLLQNVRHRCKRLEADGN